MSSIEILARTALASESSFLVCDQRFSMCAPHALFLFSFAIVVEVFLFSFAIVVKVFPLQIMVLL